MEYMSTERGHLPPLTLAASPPGWDDYLDLGETVTEMANRLMEEDGQQAKTLAQDRYHPQGERYQLRLRHYHQRRHYHAPGFSISKLSTSRLFA